MTISLGNIIPSFQPRFTPTGDVPSTAPKPTRGSQPVDSFERVGSTTSNPPKTALERAQDKRDAKIGVAVGAAAAVGLIALFFANPLVGTAAILLSAVGIIAGSMMTSRAKS